MLLWIAVVESGDHCLETNVRGKAFRKHLNWKLFQVDSSKHCVNTFFRTIKFSRVCLYILILQEHKLLTICFSRWFSYIFSTFLTRSSLSSPQLVPLFSSPLAPRPNLMSASYNLRWIWLNDKYYNSVKCSFLPESSFKCWFFSSFQLRVIDIAQQQYVDFVTFSPYSSRCIQP